MLSATEYRIRCTQWATSQQTYLMALEWQRHEHTSARPYFQRKPYTEMSPNGMQPTARYRSPNQA